MEFYKAIKRQTQGIVGICKIEGKKAVYKVPIWPDFQIRHEGIVMERLTKIRSWCPHFIELYKYGKSRMSKEWHTLNYPFKNSGKTIELDMILMEYIENSYTLDELIQKDNVSNHEIYSIILQVLSAITLGYNECKFTHNDLHCSNIMLRECDINVAILYKFDDEKSILIPSMGYVPVLIDFGYSYVKDIEKHNIYCNMEHTEYGHVPLKSNFKHDIRMFLITLSNNIKHKHKYLRYICMALFPNDVYDPQTGWLKSEPSLIDDIVCMFPEKTESIFTHKTYKCIRILLGLSKFLDTTINYEDYNLQIHIDKLLSEFSKIEKVVACNYMRLYVLRLLVECSRPYVNLYEKAEDDEMILKIIKDFRHDFFNKCDTTFEYFVVDELNFGIIFESMLNISKLIASVTTRYRKPIEKPIKPKIKINGIHNWTHPWDYLQYMSQSFSPCFTYTADTKIYAIDAVNKKKSFYNIGDHYKLVNELSPIKQADFLWNLIACDQGLDMSLSQNSPFR
jgi:hypothetical protein